MHDTMWPPDPSAPSPRLVPWRRALLRAPQPPRTSLISSLARVLTPSTRQRFWDSTPGAPPPSPAPAPARTARPGTSSTIRTSNGSWRRAPRRSPPVNQHNRHNRHNRPPPTPSEVTAHTLPLKSPSDFWARETDQAGWTVDLSRPWIPWPPLRSICPRTRNFSKTLR